MLITATNICNYLLDKGFITAASVVDGDFAVVDASGRNRNFKVIRKRASGYFVKQIPHWDAQTVAMLQCEAACYWLAHNDADFASLAPLLPEFFSYDLERHVLITELIPEGENLYEFYRRVGGFPADVAGSLGRALGAYHRATGDGANRSPHRSIFPRQLPWILSADRRSSHPFKELSPATSQLFDVVESSAELPQALDELRNGWHADALMHGDMRWENCVITRRDRTSIKIVDWELADIGDPCWDVGAVIQAYLFASLMSAHANHGGLPETPGAAVEYLSEAVRPSVRACWEGYAGALQVGGAAARELFAKCVGYAAARMIQAAYEHVQFSSQVPAHALRLVRASADILRDVPQAAEHLLGAP